MLCNCSPSIIFILLDIPSWCGSVEHQFSTSNASVVEKVGPGRHLLLWTLTGQNALQTAGKQVESWALCFLKIKHNANARDGVTYYSSSVWEYISVTLVGVSLNPRPCLHVYLPEQCVHFHVRFSVPLAVFSVFIRRWCWCWIKAGNPCVGGQYEWNMQIGSWVRVCVCGNEWEGV